MAAFRDLLKDTLEEADTDENGLMISGTFAR